MSNLTKCLKKAGTAIDAADADAIRAAFDAYRADGMDAKQAAIEAVADAYDEAVAELNQIADAARAHGIAVEVDAKPVERPEAIVSDNSGADTAPKKFDPKDTVLRLYDGISEPVASGEVDSDRYKLFYRYGDGGDGKNRVVVFDPQTGLESEFGTDLDAAFKFMLQDAKEAGGREGDALRLVRKSLKEQVATRTGQAENAGVAPRAPEVGTDDRTAAAPQLDQGSPGALEGAPSERVPAPGAGGAPRKRAPRGSRGNVGRDGDAQGAGVRPPAGVGNGTADLFVPAGGTEGTGPQVGLNTPPPQFTPSDFTIDDDLALGDGGAKTKYRRNVDAIRLLKQLDAEGRPATPDEQRTLALYVGWGGLSQAFDPDNKDWTREHAELNDLLTPDEYATAKRSTQYAHYTSREIIKAMYEGVRRLGFTGGKVLEAGGGVGNFIGLMPHDLRSAGRFTLVEREKIAAGIAKYLYPRQNVQNADYTEFGAGEDGAFDMVIGNPPFGSVQLTDQSGRKHLSGMRLHNYFIAKGIDLLRDGGILANVVSNGFLDALERRTRDYIGQRAEFLGAIRLPNDAFAKNAGTEVTTDIVFFRKLPEAEWGSRAAAKMAATWAGSGEVRGDDGRLLNLNDWMAKHRDMMLGRWGLYGTMYGPDSPALESVPGQDTPALLAEAIKKLPEGVYKPLVIAKTNAMTNALRAELHDQSVRIGGYYTEGGKLWQRIGNDAGVAMAEEVTPESPWTEKTKLGERRHGLLVAAADLRRTVRALLAAEAADDTKAIDSLRKTMNQQYDALVKEYGPLNDRYAAQTLDDDPDYPLLAALEVNYKAGISAGVALKHGLKATKPTAEKAPIFTQRVIEARAEVSKAENPEDALYISIAERGAIDADYIASLLGKPVDGLLESMTKGEKPALFVDPATNEYVLRDAYLSGNVRAKLAVAKAANMLPNVLALEEVLPKDRPASQITANLGAPWIPLDVYSDFGKTLFGDDADVWVTRSSLTNAFTVTVHGGSKVALESTYGTPRKPGDTLYESLLNTQPVMVYDPNTDGTRTLNKTETENAKEKATQISEKFGDWIMADPDRAAVVARAYNDANNNYVPRVFDGSRLRLPGKVPDSIAKFRRHQSNFVARVVQTRTALADHVVGAGKTYAAIAAAMELKRTGLARKPMIVVPNHLVKMWAKEFYTLYPGANILAASKKDFERSNRRKFLARIATGDWDAVIVAHSSFGFIKPSPDFELKFNEEQVKDIQAAIREAEANEGGGNGKRKSRTVKRLEAMLERIENRIKALRQKPVDDLLDFGQLGVDQLFVDEAHLFKNLMFITQMQNVRNLGDPAGSQRAYDMLLKTREVMAKNGGDRGVVFLTGTPVSNSLAETYHMMRYLMPSEMDAQGFKSFDAWAQTFAEIKERLTSTTAGGYKNVTTFQSFNNARDLVALFDQVSDTVTMDQIKAAFREETGGKEFPIPPLKTGRRQPIALEISPAQKEFMLKVAERAAMLEQRKGPPKKGEDNHLKLMSDARKAAMDIRLADLGRLRDPATAEREKGGRIDRAAQEIAWRYRQWTPQLGTQLVFSDMGVPVSKAKGEVKEYRELREIVARATDMVRLRADAGDEAAIAIVEDADEAQEKIDKKGRDWVDAVEAAERGFSIYDDLRKALVERGLPEGEIAFIHDYNTDDQKAALFQKVNDGKIRVLIGSTEKMGAGTNVQKRLVALHHMDIPWRPSDVEQREGRIVRQGNSLYGTVPGFEVEVLAYVTKDTLDKKMWEIQERKIHGINQLRTRQIEDSIDNVFDDMEMSASEMQAAATGDPRLLRVITLDNEIRKLERKQRSHNSERAEDAAARSRAVKDIPLLEAEAKAADNRFANRQDYRRAVDAEAAKFSVVIDGKAYTSRAEAAGALTAAVDATVKNDKGELVAAPLSVTMDGTLYTVRDKLMRTWRQVAGDHDLIAFANGGKTYTSRALAAKAIEADVSASLKADGPVEIGTFGPVRVTVDVGPVEPIRGGNGKTGNGFDVLLLGPNDPSPMKITGDPIETTASGQPSTEAIAAAVMRDAAGAIGKEYGRYNGDYQRAQIENRKKLLADLEAKGDIGEWKQTADLEKMRAEHRELTNAIKAEADAKVAKVAAEAEAAKKATEEGSDDGFMSLPAPAGAARGPVDLAKVRAAAKAANAEYGVVVNVVPNTKHESLPARVRGTNPTAEGYTDGKEVWIFTDNLRSLDHAQVVLAHEIAGHVGVEAIVGPDEWQPIVRTIQGVLDGTIKAGTATQVDASNRSKADVPAHVSPQVVEAVLAARQRYPDAGPTLLAKEAVAIMAERGIKASIIDRLLAALRRMLRRVFNRIAWTDAELRDLLARAAAHLRERATEDDAEPKIEHDAVDAYSVPPPQSFAQQIAQWFRDRVGIGPALDLGRTPAVLRMVGMADLPLRMTRGVLQKVASGKAGERAPIAQSTLRRFPELIDEAAAVFFDPANGSYVVLTTTTDSDEKPLLIAVKPDRRAGFAAVNVVATAYGKDNSEAWAIREAEAGNVLFTDPEKQNPALSLTTPRWKQAVEGSNRATDRTILGPADLRNFREKARGETWSLPGDPNTEAGADAILKAVDMAGREAGRRTLGQWLGDAIDTSRPGWMKLLSRSQIVEIGKDAQPAAVPFDRMARAMEATTNALMEPASILAEQWSDLITKHEDKARDLAAVMHDATLMQYDPAGGYEAIRQANNDPQKRALLVRYNNLGEPARALYRSVRDLYRKRRKLYMEAVIDRIEAAVLEGRKKAAMIDSVRAMMESADLEGPYFPLGRFGDFWVAARKGDGPVEYAMYETAGQWRDALARMAAEGYEVLGRGKKVRELNADHAPGAGFMSDLVGILDDASGDTISKDAADALKDAAWQLYLEALPELSVRKHNIHRKGTLGYTQDALRVFAHQMTHGAKQIARLRYGHRLGALVRTMRDSADTAADPAKAADVAAALDSSYQWMMNPTGSATATRLTSLGFAWHLGVSPAAGIVNLFQNVTIAWPVLGSRFGFDRAGAALIRASADYLRTTGLNKDSEAARAALDAEYGGDLGKALSYLEASGIIDRTQTMALTGMGEERAQLSLAQQKAMRVIGWVFHQAERYNREATAIAAYRLARDTGATHEAAQDYAYGAVNRAHYDYSNANRAPVFRSDWAKVLFLFKQYAQNTLFLMWRDLHQATRGESPQVRREARRELAGILGMTGILAGAKGLPLYSLIMGTLTFVAAMLSTLGGDDDDPPWDAEHEFRVWLAKHLGKQAGEAVASGVVNAYGGFDLSRRISMDELLIRGPDRPMEGRELAMHYLEQAAGPVLGIGVNTFRGADQIAQGEILRGVETLLPKFLKDMLKAARFQREGALNMSGQPIADDLTWVDAMIQFSGFTPAKVSQAYERAAIASRIEAATLARRTELLAAFYEAVQLPDPAARQEAVATAVGAVKGWNERNPDWPITADQVRASVRGRAQAADRNLYGINVTPRVRTRLEAEPY